MKKLTVLLLTLVFQIQIFSQIYIEQEISPVISTCGNIAQSQVCIYNDSPYPIRNASLKISYEEGLKMTKMISDGSIELNSKTFPLEEQLTVLNIVPCSKICFTIFFEYDCLAFTGPRNILVSIQNEQKNIESKASIVAFSPELELSSMEINYDPISKSFSRIFQLTNVGNIKLRDFTLSTNDWEYLTILSSSKAKVSIDGREMVFGSIDFQSIGNQDGSFDPGEYLIINQEIKIEKCFENRKFTFDFILNCNNKSCKYNVKSFQNNNISISGAQLNFRSKLLGDFSICDTIVMEIKVFSKVRKSFNSVTNAYNVEMEIGWLSNSRNGYYYYDHRLEFKEIIFYNQRFPLTLNGKIFPFNCSIFSVDPDGPKGLQDLDQDGEFDDLLAGDTISFLLTARVNSKSFDSNCRRNFMLPNHTLGINFRSEDFCNNTFIDSSDRREYSGDWVNFEIKREYLMTNVYLSKQFYEEGNDTLNLVGSNYYFPLCRNAKVRYSINLPAEMERDSTVPIVSNKGTQLISGNNKNFIIEAFLADNIKIVVNNSCNERLSPASVIQDSTECYYCIQNYYPQMTILYSTEFKCGEFCDEWIALECNTNKNFIVNCSKAAYEPKRERGFLKIDAFELNRVSYGFKDSTRTVKVNPISDSLKLNSISQLDTFHILVKISPTCTKMNLNQFVFILDAEYAYNNDIRQVFFPFEFYEYFTTFYKRGVVFYRDTQDIFSPITLVFANNGNKVFQFDSSRILNDWVFSNTTINQFDSIVLIIVGRISKDVPHNINGDFYRINGQLSTVGGNCSITENIYRSFSFCNRNINSIQVLPGYKHFTGKKLGIFESNSLNCDSVQMVNGFSYYHNWISDHDFPNEFRLPYNIKTLENKLPDYWRPYSIGELNIYNFSQGGQKYFTNTQNNSSFQYSQINTNYPFRRTSFDLESYLKPYCYVNIMDSIETIATVDQYIDKAEVEEIKLYDKFYYKLPGLKLNSFFNRVLFIKDSMADWYFNIETPENFLSSNKNLSDIEHYYKFNNSWLYIESPNTLIKPVELEVLSPGGTSRTIFPTPMVRPNAWIFKLDSIQKIVQCRLNIINRACHQDSVKIILGNSCEGYPSDLKTIPKTCIDYAPQLHLLLDPRPVVINFKSQNYHREINLSKCDTIHENLRISNLGLGYASKTVIHAKVPSGVKLVNATAIYTISSLNQYNIPISFNPVLKEFDIVFTPYVTSGLLPGFTEYDSSIIDLRLIFSVDCGLDNGTSINYRISYEEVCSKPFSIPITYAPRLYFKESILADNYSLDYKIEKFNSCSKDFVLKVIATRKNSNFNKGDKITISYTNDFGFNPQIPINSVGLKGNSYKYLSDNETESLTFELNDGLKKDDSVIIRIPMNSHCVSNCKSTSIDLKIEELRTINCTTFPTGRCDHYSVTQAIKFNNVKLYPDIRIDSAKIEFLRINSGLVELSSKIVLSSQSEMELPQNIIIKLFYDKNQNGRIDHEDVWLKSLSNTFFIVNDSAYLLKSIHKIDVNLACPLLIVLFKEDNPCLCYSDTLMVPIQFAETPSDEYFLCESEELFIDFRKQLSNGIIISFESNPYLTKLAENYFVFKKSIKSGSSKEYEELFYDIEIAGFCHSTNKVQIVIDPNCQKEAIDPKIYFPDVFSPNGDGINDDLILVEADQIEKILQLNIYDRWGVLVHSRNQLPAQDNLVLWNGEMKGRKLNPGVYTYFIQMLTKDGKQFNLTGDITLLR